MSQLVRLFSQLLKFRLSEIYFACFNSSFERLSGLHPDDPCRHRSRFRLRLEACTADICSVVRINGSHCPIPFMQDSKFRPKLIADARRASSAVSESGSHSEDP